MSQQLQIMLSFLLLLLLALQRSALLLLLLALYLHSAAVLVKPSLPGWLIVMSVGLTELGVALSVGAIALK